MSNKQQKIQQTLAILFEGLSQKEKQAQCSEIREILFRQYSTQNKQPVDFIQWVPIEKVKANNYNPNAVAAHEMRLLYTSIEHDGYTQPIVCFYDAEQDFYIIVDGFHRYTTMRQNSDIYHRNNGLLPIVVIEKNINERMASTVRHNRARGRHSADGMSNMVFKMLQNGMDDTEVCNELGLEPDELLRLKHITGFSKLFENAEYSKAWVTMRELLLQNKYKQEHPNE